MNKKHKTAVIVLIVAAVFAALSLSGYSVAVNTTPSMPKGVYLVSALDQPTRGTVVGMCIPNQVEANVYRERGYIPPSSRCVTGVAPLLKPVAAGPNDEVRLDVSGTWVNGVLLPNSRVFDTDSQGRPIRHLPLGWSKKLGAGEYFMLANHIERSLDSRYYGTVHRNDMRSLAKPVFMF